MVLVLHDYNLSGTLDNCLSQHLCMHTAQANGISPAFGTIYTNYLFACLAALRIACSAHSPRHTVEYVIYKLGKRLNNPSWLVVLKGLMTFHRLLRECDASFQEQVTPHGCPAGVLLSVPQLSCNCPAGNAAVYGHTRAESLALVKPSYACSRHLVIQMFSA